MAQKAKCGFCPCCTRVTQDLVPASYVHGKDDRKKDRAIRLWRKFGPSATRYFAAAIYQNSYGSLSSGWNWVAASHACRLPAPLTMAAKREGPRDSQSSVRADEPSLAGRPPIGFPPPSPCPSSVFSCPAGPMRLTAGNKDSASCSSAGQGNRNPFAKPPPPVRPDLKGSRDSGYPEGRGRSNNWNSDDFGRWRHYDKH